MSLTALVRTKTFRDLLAPLVDAIPRPKKLPIRFAPQTENHSLVGTAFDYLFRFEVQRRYPHSEHHHWVAETALAIAGFCGASSAERLAIHEVIAQARQALAAHRDFNLMTAGQLAVMGEHALRLAKVESLLRAGKPPMDLLLTDAADIADLVALVNAVPWDEFDCAGRILLNPFFGNVSPRLGGADADLLLGTCLIDIKVIQSWVAVEHLRQIVGYFLAAR